MFFSHISFYTKIYDIDLQEYHILKNVVVLLTPY